MRWYNHLYVGEKAKKHRFSIIQNIREEKYFPGIYIITPACGDHNILDIYPVVEFSLPFHRETEELLVIGIADGYWEAVEVAARIVSEMYEKTGDFCLKDFLL